MAEDLAAAFDHARQAMESFFQSLAESSMPILDFSPTALTGEENPGLNIPLSLDSIKAGKDLSALTKEAGKQLKLTADASGVVSAGQGALNQLRSLFASASLSLKANVQLTGVSNLNHLNSRNSLSDTPASVPSLNYLMKAATGGRFAGRTQIEIAEDGDPEYVIPVKKEDIALPLLKQLIGELSDSAKETLRIGMGKPDADESYSKGTNAAGISGSGKDSDTFHTKGTISGREGLVESQDLAGSLREQLVSAAAAAPIITQNNHHTVQAPVSINVTAAAADPVAVGTSVYNIVEQYLLRTLS